MEFYFRVPKSSERKKSKYYVGKNMLFLASHHCFHSYLNCHFQTKRSKRRLWNSLRWSIYSINSFDKTIITMHIMHALFFSPELTPTDDNNEWRRRKKKTISLYVEWPASTNFHMGITDFSHLSLARALQPGSSATLNGITSHFSLEESISSRDKKGREEPMQTLWVNIFE